MRRREKEDALCALCLCGGLDRTQLASIILEAANCQMGMGAASVRWKSPRIGRSSCSFLVAAVVGLGRREGGRGGELLFFFAV